MDPGWAMKTLFTFITLVMFMLLCMFVLIGESYYAGLAGVGTAIAGLVVTMYNE